jgi:hypothetical protein
MYSLYRRLITDLWIYRPGSLILTVHRSRRQEMQSDIQRMQELEGRIGLLEKQRRAEAASAGRWRAVAVLAVVVGLLVGGAQPGVTQTSSSLEAQVKALETKVTALESKLVYVTRQGQDMIITGANLYIRNGTGRTDTLNGRGNLIIGYNEGRPPNPDGSDANNRSGSHNLVLSSQNNFSSYAGIVAGFHSSISAPYACVTGGRDNTASGLFASISGGYFNTAAGSGASVSGGRNNQALGHSSAISGGYNNFVYQNFGSISGGRGNEVNAQYATISGGLNHMLVGHYDWLAGSLFQDD